MEEFVYRVRPEYLQERMRDLEQHFAEIRVGGVSTISKIELFEFLDHKGGVR